MKKINLLLLASIFIFNSCKKTDDDDPNIIRLETDLEISDFIWKGLNQYYYWQESVPNLSDRNSKALFDAVKKGMGIRERYENFTNYLNNDIREEYHQERLFNVGDMVSIIESKPISKLKKWRAISNTGEKS